MQVLVPHAYSARLSAELMLNDLMGHILVGSIHILPAST